MNDRQPPTRRRRPSSGSPRSLATSAAAVLLAVLACAACSASQNKAEGSAPPASLGSVAVGTTALAPESGDTASAQTESAATDQVGLSGNEGAAMQQDAVVATMASAIETLPWPADHTVAAQDLWDSKMAPAAADTSYGEADAIGMVEIWNICAWSIEAAEAAAEGDQPRADAAATQLRTLDSQYRFTAMEEALTEIANEAEQGRAERANGLIDANDCQDWPSS